LNSEGILIADMVTVTIQLRLKTAVTTDTGNRTISKLLNTSFKVIFFWSSLG